MLVVELTLKGTLSFDEHGIPMLPYGSFPKQRVPYFGGPYNKGPTIKSTILGSPIFGKPHIVPGESYKLHTTSMVASIVPKPELRKPPFQRRPVKLQNNAEGSNMNPQQPDPEDENPLKILVERHPHRKKVPPVGRLEHQGIVFKP